MIWAAVEDITERLRAAGLAAVFDPRSVDPGTAFVAPPAFTKIVNAGSCLNVDVTFPVWVMYPDPPESWILHRVLDDVEAVMVALEKLRPTDAVPSVYEVAGAAVPGYRVEVHRQLRIDSQ